MTSTLVHVCANTGGSAHLEAVISTGLKYAVPRHGDPARWDWGLTIRSLDFALQKHRMLADFAANMTPEQRAWAWQSTTDEARRLRKVMA